MGKVNYDQHAALLFMENLNMMVPYYLMAAYAYYKEDDPIFSDAFFDNMGKTMLNAGTILHIITKNILTKVT